MRLSQLPDGLLRSRLRHQGLALRTGPFVFRVRSPLPVVAEGLQRLYGEYPLVPPSEFADFEVLIDRGPGLRRWFRPQARFMFDGRLQFEPLPARQGFLLLEWAMNWCISTHAHHLLILHAAVIERNGLAAILPAPSGSGKSTLCAGLVSRGWRLLSDELTLISLADGAILPLGRPISLKNRSIDVIRDFAPTAVFNRVTPDALKGVVSHVKLADQDFSRIEETARPRWIVFPRFRSSASPRLSPRSPANSLLELGRNAFNYAVLGRTGFEVLADMVAACDCYDFEYGALDDAVDQFDGLARQAVDR